MSHSSTPGEDGPQSHQVTLEHLLENGRTLRPTRAHAPDIWLITWKGQQILIKTYQHTSILYRNTVGRWAMNREWWALRALEGSGCAPYPYFRISPWSVAMEFVPGVPLEKLERGAVPAEELVREGERLLATLTHHRVVHSDLGHDHWGSQGRECNLIWNSERRRLVAIDFAGCVQRRRGLTPWSRLTESLWLHDALLLTKLLYQHGDDTTSDHSGWKLPSQRTVAWWKLMRLLGKV